MILDNLFESKKTREADKINSYLKSINPKDPEIEKLLIDCGRKAYRPRKPITDDELYNTGLKRLRSHFGGIIFSIQTWFPLSDYVQARWDKSTAHQNIIRLGLAQTQDEGEKVMKKLVDAGDITLRVKPPYDILGFRIEETSQRGKAEYVITSLPIWT